MMRTLVLFVPAALVGCGLDAAGVPEEPAITALPIRPAPDGAIAAAGRLPDGLDARASATRLEWTGDLDGDGRADRIVLTGDRLRGPTIIDYDRMEITLGGAAEPAYVVEVPGGHVGGSGLEDEIGHGRRRLTPLVGPLAPAHLNDTSVPNLVFNRWYGGNNQGCEVILEIRNGKVRTLHDGYLSRLDDLDHDGIPEILTPVLYTHGRHPRLVPGIAYRWAGDRYEPANRKLASRLAERFRDGGSFGGEHDDLSLALTCGDFAIAERLAEKACAQMSDPSEQARLRSEFAAAATAMRQLLDR
jgi:hypothetical protein